MTVSSETSRVQYTGAGTTGPFSAPFYFLVDADLVVIKTLISSGVEVTLALTTDYTVAGAGDPAGGSVTLVAALSALYKLTIVRDADKLQETNYLAGDPFPAESHERALDKLTMIVQRAIDKADRSFRLSDGDVSGVSLILSNLGADKVLVVNSAGDGIEGASVINVGLTPVSAFIVTLLDDVDAATALATLGAEPADATILKGADIGTSVQAYDVDTAKLDAAETFTSPQRGTITTDNDLSFDQNVTNNFLCTPSAGGTLTFTNHTAGQSGFIKLINGSNYAIAAAATTKISAADLSRISATGVYVLSYFDDGTNAYVVSSVDLT